MDYEFDYPDEGPMTALGTKPHEREERTMKHFDSADELRDYLTDLNVGDVPGVEAVAGCVILVTGTPWLAYCTDPDAEWFFECGDPEERMTEDSEGWREYDRIGMDWIGPQVDAHGADLLWPRSAEQESR